jgi:hypothetical protein
MATLRIGFHLSIHGIRRDAPFQVIDLVPRALRRLACKS